MGSQITTYSIVDDLDQIRQYRKDLSNKMTFSASRMVNLDSHYRHSIIDSILRSKPSLNLNNHHQLHSNDVGGDINNEGGTQIMIESSSDKVLPNGLSSLTKYHNLRETSDQIGIHNHQNAHTTISKDRGADQFDQKKDIELIKELVNYREPYGGNQTIHFAVVNGNKRVIDIILHKFHADPHALTLQGLNVMHCAAQSDRGVLSLYYFNSIHGQFKSVESLLGMGSDPNNKINGGQTCLHLAVTKFVEEMIKAKLLWIYQRITERNLMNKNTQIWQVFWQDMLFQTQSIDNVRLFYSFGFASIFFFIFSIVFYITSNCMDPGFARQKYPIIDILQIANDKNIDLENFCFYCKIIKSNRTFHCMFCNSCVDKFDHHCAYINNCLGYRNHKYFLLFLLSIFLYFITSMTVCIAGIVMYGSFEFSNLGVYMWIIRIYTITINLLQFIPLGYQLYEQTRKIFRVEIDDEETRTLSKTDRASVLTANNIHRRTNIELQNSQNASQNQMSSNPNSNQNINFQQMLLSRSNDIVIEKRSICQNIRMIFRYEPATQEQLRVFLLSNSERFSTFILKQKDQQKQLEQRRYSSIQEQ
ncbi:dhhc zinc finger domain containing protein [Stylonychia lemnae]|uniref:Palmitoyltransferase n=1 Tax=Stylonychia lemnae TaxID=5949 RepID=A0A078AI94_STYLE|nr:dhhc zinc finger domain containing protein [Stylonychia lemnae]|eukprot:CDW81985.1 dhhc zinc finger domain containing protein [Stylonychia lemnae]